MNEVHGTGFRSILNESPVVLKHFDNLYPGVAGRDVQHVTRSHGFS